MNLTRSCKEDYSFEEEEVIEALKDYLAKKNVDFCKDKCSIHLSLVSTGIYATRNKAFLSFMKKKKE